MKNNFKIFYSNAEKYKAFIFKENNKKSGIYKWQNLITKFCYSNFSLEILEYCEKDILIQREQYYIDHLDPKYNICKKAGSTLGRKCSLATKEKISIALRGKKKLSIETKDKLKGRGLGRKLSL